MQLIATCPEETKPVLVLELEALGARGIAPGYRAVAFEASDALFYELHLKLRTASRILRVIKEVPAKSPAMLRSQVRRIRWHELFDARHGFMVDIQGDHVENGADKGGMAAKQIITQVRESIREVFERAQGVAPVVDTVEPKIVVVAHLRHGRCMLSFDTTGKSLHKRGYREQGHPAPLKETLSAAILIMAGYDGSQAFMDPMCGSGTIAIEAAMIAVHKASQIHRKKGEFHFEWLKDFDRDLWRVTQDRVRAEKLEAPTAPVLASDINAAYVAMTK
jgi:putative N6-adenine-specific DNA methylase